MFGIIPTESAIPGIKAWKVIRESSLVENMDNTELEVFSSSFDLFNTKKICPVGGKLYPYDWHSKAGYAAFRKSELSLESLTSSSIEDGFLSGSSITLLEDFITINDGGGERLSIDGRNLDLEVFYFLMENSNCRSVEDSMISTSNKELLEILKKSTNPVLLSMINDLIANNKSKRKFIKVKKLDSNLTLVNFDNYFIIEISEELSNLVQILEEKSAKRKKSIKRTPKKKREKFDPGPSFFRNLLEDLVAAKYTQKFNEFAEKFIEDTKGLNVKINILVDSYYPEYTYSTVLQNITALKKFMKESPESFKPVNEWKYRRNDKLEQKDLDLAYKNLKNKWNHYVCAEGTEEAFKFTEKELELLNNCFIFINNNKTTDDSNSDTNSTGDTTQTPV